LRDTNNVKVLDIIFKIDKEEQKRILEVYGKYGNENVR